MKPRLITLSLQLIACGAEPTSSSSSSSSTSSSPSTSGIETAETTQTTIEEGDRALYPFNGMVESVLGGFTGRGYINSVNSAGTHILWSFQVHQPGEYRLSLRYANGGTTDHPAQLQLDQQHLATLAFAPSSQWNKWQALHALAAEGVANIDSLTFTGANEITPVLYPERPPRNRLTRQGLHRGQHISILG